MSTVIWDLMLCSLVNVNRHFGATHYIRLQDRLIKSSKQTSKQSDSCVLHAASYLTFVYPAHSSILDVKAVRSVTTSVNIYHTTQSHKPNDRLLTVTVVSTLKLIQLILSLYFIKHRQTGQGVSDEKKNFMKLTYVSVTLKYMLVYEKFHEILPQCIKCVYPIFICVWVRARACMVTKTECS